MPARRDPIPTAEAAARKGCTRQAIINALGRGELNGRKVGPIWLVEDDARLEAWAVRETGGRAHASYRASAPSPAPSPAETADTARA